MDVCILCTHTYVDDSGEQLRNTSNFWQEEDCCADSYLEATLKCHGEMLASLLRAKTGVPLRRYILFHVRGGSLPLVVVRYPTPGFNATVWFVYYYALPSYISQAPAL